MSDTFERLAEAELYLQSLIQRIQKPFAIVDANKIRGFRFGNPGAVHYVVLNIARSLSLLNAMLLLRHHGFRGELAMLARVLKENSSKLEYVVGGLSQEGPDKKTTKFLQEFFEDNNRDTSKRPRYAPINQKDINRRNSEKVSNNIEYLKFHGIDDKIDNNSHQYATIESDLINIFSNHVHGRYPEMMDIFGEFSLKPQLRGNLESQDIDQFLEIEFVDECANGFLTGFKVALLKLNMSKLINLSGQERTYCVSGVF